jgi:O-antigen ligase
MDTAQTIRPLHAISSRRNWSTEFERAREKLRTVSFDAVFFGLAVCAVPVSIAVAESFIAVSLAFRIAAVVSGRTKIVLPRVFWFWLVWAALEITAWRRSPDVRIGGGEMRHLALIAVLFLLVPSIPRASDRVLVWCGVAWTTTVSSLVLIGHFIWRLLYYRGSLAPVIYLRGGGLLHHWMVFGTVEIIVLAALLELWHYFPEKRGWLLPVLVVNAIAIVLSLTRMLWICSFLLVALDLAGRRSRWLWAVPVIPCVLFLIAPSPVRSRVTESSHLEYYSNAERLQMWRVGWRIVREKPWFGVGPGRINGIYTTYLSPADPVPAYHGHLHNNLVQLAAEFGLPVAGAAVLFTAILFRDLRRRCRVALDRDQEFVCRAALLGLTGFVAAGIFDYTYGHSLGLNLLAFAVLSPLVPEAEAGSGASHTSVHRRS